MAQNNYISVKVPIKPYLKKFVASLYGSEIIVNYQTQIGIILLLCLDKQLYENRHNNPEAQNTPYTDSITFFINKWTMQGVGFSIAPEKVRLINNYFEAHFVETLYAYTELHIGNNPNRYKGFGKTYEAFADKYGIVLEDDIKMDTLIKKEYRYRKELLNTQIKMSQSATLF